MWTVAAEKEVKRRVTYPHLPTELKTHDIKPVYDRDRPLVVITLASLGGGHSYEERQMDKGEREGGKTGSNTKRAQHGCRSSDPRNR